MPSVVVSFPDVRSSAARLFHRLAEVLFGKCIYHGVLVLASPMSSASVVFNYAFNPATRFIMQSRICECLFAFVARKFNACQQTDSLRIVQRLEEKTSSKQHSTNRQVAILR